MERDVLFIRAFQLSSRVRAIRVSGSLKRLDDSRPVEGRAMKLRCFQARYDKYDRSWDYASRKYTAAKLFRSARCIEPEEEAEESKLPRNPSISNVTW